jgi:hypothetical protein
MTTLLLDAFEPGKDRSFSLAQGFDNGSRREIGNFV